MASADTLSDTFSYEENKINQSQVLDEKLQNIYNTGIRNLEAFFRDQFNFKTPSKTGNTNVVDQRGGITWAFPDDTFAELMHHVEECRKEGSTLHLSERQRYDGLEESGIMLDFDCKYKVAKPEIKRTDKSNLIEAIMEIIVDTLDHTNIVRGQSDTKVGMIERPRSSILEKENLYKKGFHLLIPGIRLNSPHKKYIVSEIRKSPRVGAILKDMSVVNYDDACDANSASVPVLFIGSCKMNGGLKYELTGVWDVPLTPGRIRPQEIHDLKTLSKYNLAYEFCLTHEAKYRDGSAPLIVKNVFRAGAGLDAKIDSNYARTMNGILTGSDMILAENKVNALVHASPDALYMQGLLEILSTEYYTDRNKWRDVIFALANSSNSRVDYKWLAIWFSQKCPEKWSQGGPAALDEIWEESRIRITVGATSGAKFLTDRSIAYWARLCDKDRYALTTQENYFHKLQSYSYEYSGQIENSMVADILFSMLKYKFTVDYEGKTPVWYEFITNEDHGIQYGEVWKWRKEPSDPISLQQYMTDKLPEIYNRVVKKFEDSRKQHAENKEKGKFYVQSIKNLSRSRTKLFTNIFKRHTIKECIDRFVKRGFAKQLDVTCPYIFGVGNGVLELSRKSRFIDHYHEHPISKATSVPWKGHFDPERPDAHQQKLLDMIADIIIENDARIKIMMFLSTGLVGGVKNTPLLLIVGGGSNGKTVLMSLTMETLGRDVYSSFINPQVYSKQPESADRANSSLMQFKGKNFTVGEETNKGDPLCPAALKGNIFSSGVSSRELHSKQESFQISATQIVTSQYEFIVPTTDHGTWRRLSQYIARTKFCANPDPANIFETKDDPKCREYPNDKNYQIAWLQILVYFYEWFQDVYDGNYANVSSPTIDAITEKFRNDQDKINQFIYKFVAISPSYATEGPDAILENVAMKYLKWYDMNHGAKKQTLSDIIKEFENSSIQKYLRRNRQGSYETFGIRVLDEKDFLRAGETYFKPRTEDYQTRKDSKVFWWKRPDAKMPETKTSETKTSENKTDVVAAKNVEKRTIAIEHGNDKDFIAKKVVEKPQSTTVDIMDDYI